MRSNPNIIERQNAAVAIVDRAVKMWAREAARAGRAVNWEALAPEVRARLLASAAEELGMDETIAPPCIGGAPTDYQPV